MEQHPVPQNISSYEFRLVGDMTLKQFFQLAGGVLVGIIFFRLPIAGIFKYPLTFISVIIGVLSAFVPFQGRPFNQWLIAFFRAIYSPTEYLWTPTPIVPIAPPEPTAVSAISNTRSQSQIFTGFASFFASLLSPKTPKAPLPVQDVVPPQLKTEVPPPPQTPPQPVTEMPKITPFIPSPAPPTPETKPAAPTTTTFSVAPPIIKTPAPSHPNTQMTPKTTTPTPEPTSQVIAPPPKPLEPTKFPGLPQITPPTTSPAAAVKATAATAISPPTTTNVLAGLVTDSQNIAISGATVEIIDSHTGIPARALRTNRLGQFQIAIPLPAGSYIINTEKTGFVFEPVSVQIQNTIVPPIIIQSQNI